MPGDLGLVKHMFFGVHCAPGPIIQILDCLMILFGQCLFYSVGL